MEQATRGRFKALVSKFMNFHYTIFLLPFVRTSVGQGSSPGGVTQIFITKGSESSNCPTCFGRCHFSLTFSVSHVPRESPVFQI